MLSKEERISEVKRRIAENRRRQGLRRSRAVALCAAAVCLALIAGLSFLMPAVSGQGNPGGYSSFETAASIFGGSDALGYIVIGLLAFLLGVCVTVLCFRLRNRERQQREGQ